jgi:hypothetical protein
VRTCTEDDYKGFFPIVKQDTDFLRELQKKEALNCIEDEDLLTIRGTSEIDAVVLNIDLIPCLNSV